MKLFFNEGSRWGKRRGLLETSAGRIAPASTALGGWTHLDRPGETRAAGQDRRRVSPRGRRVEESPARPRRAPARLPWRPAPRGRSSQCAASGGSHRALCAHLAARARGGPGVDGHSRPLPCSREGRLARSARGDSVHGREPQVAAGACARRRSTGAGAAGRPRRPRRVGAQPSAASDHPQDGEVSVAPCSLPPGLALEITPSPPSPLDSSETYN